MKLLITTAVGLLTLTACQNTDNMRLRVAGGAGTADYKLKVPSAGIDGDESGNQGSLRVELANRPEGIENVEVGLRFIGGIHDLSETSQGVTLDLDTRDIGGVAVIRPYLPVSEDVSLYLEGFGGYRVMKGDVTLSGFGQSLGGDGTEDGWLYGAGAGVEFSLGQSTSLVLGVEWSRTTLQEQGVHLDIDDFTGLVGVSIGF